VTLEPLVPMVSKDPKDPLDHKVSLVHEDSPVLLEIKVNRDQLVRTEKTERLDLLGLKVRKDRLDLKVKLDHKGRLDLLDLLVKPDLLVRLDLKDLLVLMVHLALLGPMEKLDLPDQPEKQEPLAKMAQLVKPDQKDLQVLQERTVLKERLELLVPLVHQALSGRRVPLDLKDHKDSKVYEVIVVNQARKVKMELLLHETKQVGSQKSK